MDPLSEVLERVNREIKERFAEGRKQGYVNVAQTIDTSVEAVLARMDFDAATTDEELELADLVARVMELRGDE
jgi:hypothetical protein